MGYNLGEPIGELWFALWKKIFRFANTVRFAWFANHTTWFEPRGSLISATKAWKWWYFGFFLWCLIIFCSSKKETVLYEIFNFYQHSYSWQNTKSVLFSKFFFPRLEKMVFVAFFWTQNCSANSFQNCCLYSNSPSYTEGHAFWSPRQHNTT